MADKNKICPTCILNQLGYVGYCPKKASDCEYIHKIKEMCKYVDKPNGCLYRKTCSFCHSKKELEDCERQYELVEKEYKNNNNKYHKLMMSDHVPDSYPNNNRTIFITNNKTKNEQNKDSFPPLPSTKPSSSPPKPTPKQTSKLTTAEVLNLKVPPTNKIKPKPPPKNETPPLKNETPPRRTLYSELHESTKLNSDRPKVQLPLEETREVFRVTEVESSMLNKSKVTMNSNTNSNSNPFMKQLLSLLTELKKKNRNQDEQIKELKEQIKFLNSQIVIIQTRQLTNEQKFAERQLTNEQKVADIEYRIKYRGAAGERSSP